MVRLSGRLSSLKVTHAREPGMLADGDGLYLQVKHGNARSWIFRYFRDGKSHEMGLGSLKAVSLAAARLKAAECRGLLADGIDPIAARDAERLQRAAEDARAMTFDHCADAFIKAHSSGWKNKTMTGNRVILVVEYEDGRTTEFSIDRWTLSLGDYAAKTIARERQ